MQVGIFETTHFEVAYTLIKLFDHDQNKITVFTYESSYRQFQYLFKDNMSDYTWVVKTESESKRNFISRFYKYSAKSKFDILYLSTVSDNHLLVALFISFLRKTRIIINLHDINNHFIFKAGFSFRRWIRYLGKRALVRVGKEFNVISPTMVEYLRSRLPASKKVHCIPGSVFEESKRQEVPDDLSHGLRTIIPGTLDRRRRNYELVFDLLYEINQRGLPISFVLMGGINENGTEILEKCKQYVSDLHNLTFYQTDVVDQPIFDREMDKAHFIFIPSVIHTVIMDGVQEVYGQTLSSGTIYDVVRHGKPFIIPEQLAIPGNLESSCFKYRSSTEIIPFLESFLDHPEKYLEWNQNALHNSQAYTIEKIRKDNPNIFG